MWNDTAVSEILGIKYPIVQAPMAGGPSSPQLVAAVSNSGGLGSLGAGYMDPYELERNIETVQKITNKPFAVNIFVPEEYQIDNLKVQKMMSIMSPYRDELDLDKIQEVKIPDENFEKHIEIMFDKGIKIASFTFGVPDRKVVEKLKSKGIKVLGTATTVEEAVDLEERGIEIVVAQGSESGGHRGSYLRRAEDCLIGAMSLIPQVVDSVDIPVISAGGIMDGRGIAAALCLGASGVQMGTAFLTSSESGAKKIYKEAILGGSEDQTTLTRVFSGKLARGLRNRFTEEMQQHESDVPDYPVQNFLTRPIRNASADKNSTDYMSLWSGQGVRLSRSLSVSELMDKLIGEVDSTLKKFR